MGLRVVGIVAVAAILLGGCSDQGAPAPETKTNGGGPLRGLDGDTLCAMVDHSTIDAQFQDPVQKALGGTDSTGGREKVSCAYVTASVANAEPKDIAKAQEIGTRVRLARDTVKTAKDALDDSLRDMDAKVVKYEPIDGLGAVAGYASRDLGMPVKENRVVVILEVNGAFIEVTAHATPQGSLEQLRPIAELLVKGVKAKLG